MTKKVPARDRQSFPPSTPVSKDSAPNEQPVPDTALSAADKTPYDPMRPPGSLPWDMQF